MDLVKMKINIDHVTESRAALVDGAEEVLRFLGAQDKNSPTMKSGVGAQLIISWAHSTSYANPEPA